MITSSAQGSGESNLRHGIWSAWPRWASGAAAIWSLGYGALGLAWSLGGGGFPFGRGGDDEADYSVLVNASPETVAPVVAVLGVVGGLVALAMVNGVGRGAVRFGITAFGWVSAAALALVFTDLRILMLITRVLVTPVFVFTGVPGGGSSVADFYTWPRLNLLVLLAGGMLWGLATLTYQRRGAQTCVSCGRGNTPGAKWTAPRNALRWGRWAVVVAMAVPLVYAASRVAMALHSPIGVPQAFYDEMEGTGVVIGDLFMATSATFAAVLTLGLVRPWGEVFPRWIWFRAGQRVPPQLAIVPGLIMSVVITSAGVSELRSLFVRGFNTEEWGITGPGTLWPLWGPALAASTYAYYLRRRSGCRRCGRGRVAIAHNTDTADTAATSS